MLPYLIKIKESALVQGRIGRSEATKAQPMSFKQALTAQHHACDTAFASIEQAADRNEWEAAMDATQAFIDATEAHLDFEEQILFPALEAALPMASGPTSVMCSEHAQMRELFSELRGAVAQRDAEALADAVETLLLLMQQHNAKEENVLYPIADQNLADDLLQRLEEPRKAG